MFRQGLVALEQLAHAAASWHLQSGRNVDGSANPGVEGVVTVSPQGQAIVSRPVGKAATAEVLGVAATQAGPRRGEAAAQATAGKASLADEAAALRAAASLAGPQRGELLAKAAIVEQQAADLAKAAAARASSRRRTWGEVILQRRLDIGPTALAKAATDDLDAPAMLYKAAGR